MKLLRVIAMLACWVVAPGARAMDFTLTTGHTIDATGPIEQGDATKLQRLVRESRLADGFEDYVVRLRSPGGSLREGMELGFVIREAALQTLVGRGQECVSACALAFLGGTSRYATGLGIGRRLEVGALLGFNAGMIDALVLQYADRMKGVDLGWFARTQDVAPDSARYVRSPADVAALSIDLEGIPNDIPDNWAFNVCRLVVDSLLPTLDSFAARVQQHSDIIPTIKALREAVVSGRYDGGRVAAFAATLSDQDAIDLALGEPFNLGFRKPILEARSVPLERGAGFYYDRCLAVRTKHDVSVVLVDEVSHLLYRRDFHEHGRIDFRLALYDATAPLW